MYGLARPFLFGLDAERAHDLTLAALEAAYRSGVNPLLSRAPKPLPTKVFGVQFPNPVGLAAGLDKNGDHIDALLALGFGFVEIGTTTPRPQEGNPKPRMFRLPAQRAVINRLGFNNTGVDALVKNVERARRRGVLGINIGKNKDTPNETAETDYLYLPGARVSARRLRDGQYFLAQHRGPARTAGRTAVAPPHRHAARSAGTPGRAARPARADAGRRSRRTCRTKTSTPPAACSSTWKSMASSRPTPPSAASAWKACGMRAKPAACRASR